MRLTPKQLIAAVLAFAAVVTGAVYIGRSIVQRGQSEFRSPDSTRDAASAAYAAPGACAACHGQIASTYSRTGMGRSFSKVRPATAQLAANSRLYHEASGRHYAMLERDGKLYQRRHEIGVDGQETNAVEFEAHYVVGSGNHARTFLHKQPDGRLLEMPVSWYAERGGFWAMSPGYDRPDHRDFRRLINEDCMSCHNGYPRGAVANDGNGPKFPDALPEGIDCERCHGPGQAHIDAIQTGDVARGRRAIANPATFERERQLETCMQCHLEPTSSPLPFQIRRYENPALSYTPGKALGDYFMYFDHAPGSGRDDKFEIAGGAYRLRKSACFQRSEMTCVTCHNPHDIPRGAAAVEHYVAVCRSCHETVHGGGVPKVQGAGPRETCLDCHMPKRRTDDAVHVTMTDHYIQRRRPPGDLLAPRKETDNFEHGEYRSEVIAYYPSNLPATPENELYLALAQVQQGSNLAKGIPQLEQAIQNHKPERPEFSYELARAYAKTSNEDAVIRWSEDALRRDATFAPALKELAAAAARTGRFVQAAQALEKAVALQPKDADALADLGNVYVQLSRVDEAQQVLRRALLLDPALPIANNTMGLAAVKNGDPDAAETYFRAAIRHQPDLAEARNNLGNLLAGRRSYAEAGYQFEKAIRSNPDYAEARHSYGMVLALTQSYAKAVVELRKAIELAGRPTGSPGEQRRRSMLVQARTDLGGVLTAMGRTDEAAREYQLAIQVDSSAYDAHLALGTLLARRGRTADARRHLTAAMESPDPQTRGAAAAALSAVAR